MAHTLEGDRIDVHIVENLNIKTRAPTRPTKARNSPRRHSARNRHNRYPFDLALVGTALEQQYPFPNPSGRYRNVGGTDSEGSSSFRGFLGSDWIGPSEIIGSCSSAQVGAPVHRRNAAVSQPMIHFMSQSQVIEFTEEMPIC